MFSEVSMRGPSGFLAMPVITAALLRLIVLAVCLACAPVLYPSHAASQADAEIAAIGKTLDAFHQAESKADGKAYFDLFAPDAVFIGTDASERWPIEAFRAYAMERFQQGKGWTYKPRERHVTLAQIPCQCIAWFDELLDNAKYGTSRGTGVLTRTDQGWKIEQYALTFPIPNNLAADMTARIKEYESKAGK
jgi:hypothetical protein